MAPRGGTERFQAEPTRYVARPGSGASTGTVVGLRPDAGSVLLISVAVPVAALGTLTYNVPESIRAWVRPGCRVRVRVGKRRLVGVVWDDTPAPPEGFEVRDIEAVLDLEPALPADLLELGRFAVQYYLSTAGDLAAAMLPQKLPPWGDRTVSLTDAGALAAPRDRLDEAIQAALREVGKARLSRLLEMVPDAGLGGRIEEWIRRRRLVDLGADLGGRRFVPAVHLVAGDRDELLERCGRSPIARSVVELLLALGRAATHRELESEVGASAAVLRRMARLGILQAFRQPELLSVERHLMSARGVAPPHRLLAEQESALDAILAALERREFARFLIHGVTGSGKTEVYLRAVDAALAAGRSALLLVPEIALVPALARAARDRFGALLAVLHSNLGDAERSQEWERVRSGDARVVVGPRSALFAPVRDLGLVVVDEEQDSAYKQESSPRYHGRDLALVRCRQVGAVAVLASATPSLEARYAARAGGTIELRLNRRVGNASLPEGILVDLRGEARVAKPGETLFSSRLLEELNETVASGGQAILLRNRRGYSPLLLCRACGEDFRCDACGLPRTFHRRDRRLVCHWCGGTVPVPVTCPACNADALEPLGAGTERIEEELGALLPGLKIGVLDRDSARRVGGAAAILERFRSGETRILVGTQMLSKGHHFPGVELTAVLSADALLGFPDFRAVEKTYALLTQLGGRAGRGERPGRVVLQTFHPDHYAIQAALHHDDAAFADQEMRFRRIFDYPPFTRMVLVGVRDRDRERGRARLVEISRRIERSPGAAGLRLVGPAPAPLERLKGEWRFHLVVRGPSGRRVRAAVEAAIGGRHEPTVTVDVDPHQLL